MTQNIYDNPAFFENYSQLPRSVQGLDGAPEWPSLQALLPDLQGRRIVDLGCGLGWFCRWAQEQRAAEVLGLDVSENMLAQARATTSPGVIRYAIADLEHLQLPAASFDLAYSSLALHYIRDLASLLAMVHCALVPGGQLIFSIEHPIYMAPARPGWSVDTDGRRSWPVNDYLNEGPRTTDWLAKGVIKHHRLMGTTLNLLLQAGFTLTRIEEWSPTDDQIAAQPSLAIERIRPMFLLVAAARS